MESPFECQTPMNTNFKWFLWLLFQGRCNILSFVLISTMNGTRRSTYIFQHGRNHFNARLFNGKTSNSDKPHGVLSLMISHKHKEVSTRICCQLQIITRKLKWSRKTIARKLQQTDITFFLQILYHAQNRDQEWMLHKVSSVVKTRRCWNVSYWEQLNFISTWRSLKRIIKSVSIITREKLPTLLYRIQRKSIQYNMR